MSVTMSKSVEEITKTTVSSESTHSTTVPAQESAERSDVSTTELQSIRDEKLAAIRRAIEKGDYDSDAIFDKALTQMLQRLEESDDQQ